MQDIQIFIARLDDLINKAVLESQCYIPKQGEKEGLAFHYLGRCVSCFMGIKTLLFSLNYASEQNDFANKYKDSFPNSFPRKDADIAVRYIKETYMVVRFALFQNFYSQTEFTFRIIKRTNHTDSGKRNPFKLISEEYKIMDKKTCSLLNDIRNTIHNNGHYFPDDGTSKKHIFKGKEFNFTVGEGIFDVNMSDILEIIDYLLDECIKLFKNNSKIATIKF